MSVMQLTTALRQPAGIAAKLASWLMPQEHQQIAQWTLEQLQVQPYQHLLEVGYGAGDTLEAVAKRLKIGFIAGTDPSMSMFKQASKRNKLYIDQQLMQLHMGPITDLPYPAHYFHTIYGRNAHFQWNDPQQEIMRLSTILKPGGRLIMVFQPALSGANLSPEALTEKLEDDYLAAGLTDIRIRYMDDEPVTCIAATGYKG